MLVAISECVGFKYLGMLWAISGFVSAIFGCVVGYIWLFGEQYMVVLMAISRCV